jgi:hypothetical protein
VKYKERALFFKYFRVILVDHEKKSSKSVSYLFCIASHAAEPIPIKYSVHFLEQILQICDCIVQQDFVHPHFVSEYPGINNVHSILHPVVPELTQTPLPQRGIQI